MAHAKKLVVIGFDSISLGTLEGFVQRGVLPTVGRLIREGCVTQTWPCFPMDTGTNWAALATGASPWVSGCNMSLHLPGDPLDKRQPGFPSQFCLAEPLWTTAHKAGKRSVIFDWAHSCPLPFEEGIVHVGEDGRPDNALRALQEVRAYTTHPRQPGPHVTQIAPQADDTGALAFPVPIQPGPRSRYRTVEPLCARILSGAGGCERVALYDSPSASEPLLDCALGEWTEWTVHRFQTDLGPVRAGLRAKLIRLSPNASDVHLYLSEIYCQEDFCHPASLAPELVQRCGPFVIQCSRQQVVQGGASDIATYMHEQKTLAHWWRDAARTILPAQDWDLFMLKWHGPDWTNHLTMYMIDPRHPMHDPQRAEEGWALWDELMGWGDEILADVLDIAGPDTLVALVSDHGGDTMLPGIANHPSPNPILQEHGWLVYDRAGDIDWERSVAYGFHHWVYLNLRGRDPQGIVEPGDTYLALRHEIMEALLGARSAAGHHLYQCVLPIETAGRLGVGGDRVGDIFVLPADPPPLAKVDHEAFWRSHTVEETGTWDWPRMNAGAHSDDSYFVLCGPGVKRGYRRERPTLITSVAPTLSTAWDIPVPKDADGTILWDMLC